MKIVSRFAPYSYCCPICDMQKVQFSGIQHYSFRGIIGIKKKKKKGITSSIVKQAHKVPIVQKRAHVLAADSASLVLPFALQSVQLSRQFLH